jgi:pyruvate ferredoxin oxidoreductase gamma subunit
MVEEIRLHGQGGQGVVAAGELIAIAASYEGRFCRAFPLYGSQRRGAPVLAFAQIGDESEATRSMIYHPKYLMIFDPPMPEVMDVLDATGIAQRVIGRPIPNTVMLGAFVKTTGILKIESIDKAIEKRFPPKLAATNIDAVKMGYETVDINVL